MRQGNCSTGLCDGISWPLRTRHRVHHDLLTDLYRHNARRKVELSTVCSRHPSPQQPTTCTSAVRHQLPVTVTSAAAGDKPNVSTRRPSLHTPPPGSFYPANKYKKECCLKKVKQGILVFWYRYLSFLCRRESCLVRPHTTHTTHHTPLCVCLRAGGLVDALSLSLELSPALRVCCVSSLKC